MSGGPGGGGGGGGAPCPIIVLQISAWVLNVSPHQSPSPSTGDSSQGGQGLGALYNIYEEGNNNALLQLTEGGGGALRGAGFGASQGGGFGTYTGLLAGLEEEEDLGGGSGAICR